MCTLYPFLLFLKWGFVAGELGLFPDRRHDGPFGADDPLLQLVGTALAAKFLLVQIKGDLVEFISTLGFSGFTSTFAPCICCWCVGDCLHQYSELNLAHAVWPDPQPYHDACRACEIHVTVHNPEQLKSIFVDGQLYWDRRPRGAKGRALGADMPTLIGRCGRALTAGDRVAPSESLPDVGKLRWVQTPIELTVWRRQPHGYGCLEEPVTRYIQ